MLDFMQNIFGHFASALEKVLPMSPFTSYLDSFKNLPYLSWVNWFIPVKDCIKVVELWLIAIGLFYVYSIILRWVKAIGD